MGRISGPLPPWRIPHRADRKFHGYSGHQQRRSHRDCQFASTDREQSGDLCGRPGDRHRRYPEGRRQRRSGECRCVGCAPGHRHQRGDCGCRFGGATARCAEYIDRYRGDRRSTRSCQLRHPSCRQTTTELDHIRNVAAGGTDGDSNMQAVCSKCHAVKTQRDCGCRRCRTPGPL
ncbi:HNH endonuclease signature motif containing protein [Nocardia aurantia]|uniref:HNH endonuclease signature motif containing protein n=1 Tax=Nocardia aurantia TaxID=2585199 RepID=UPI00129567E1